MSESPTVKANVRGLNYGVELKIGDLNLSKYLSQIKIVNNISTAWPQIYLNMSVDNKVLLEKNAFGQEPLILTIYEGKEDGQLIEQTDIELLYLESNINLITKSQQDQFELTFQPSEFLTIPLKASKMMTSFVNMVVEEPKYNPIELLEKIFTDSLFANRFNIDKTGSNTAKIDQIIIPPMSINQAVKYIDYYRQYYNGPTFKFCDIHGTFNMWNMYEKMKMSPSLIISQLSTGSRDPKIVKDILTKCASDPKYMYTADNVESIYFGNAKVLKTAYNVVYTSHPSNDLYYHIGNNLENMIKNGGIYDKNSKIKFNEGLKSRKRYYHDVSGCSNLRTKWTDSLVSEKMTNLTGIKITLKRNILLENIIKIGEPVDFRPLILDYQRYGGKYYLAISDFQLTREQSDNWDGLCYLTLFRTCQSDYDDSADTKT